MIVFAHFGSSSVKSNIRFWIAARGTFRFAEMQTDLEFTFTKINKWLGQNRVNREEQGGTIAARGWTLSSSVSYRGKTRRFSSPHAWTTWITAHDRKIRIVRGSLGNDFFFSHTHALFSSSFDSWLHEPRSRSPADDDAKLFSRIWIPRGSVSSCRVSPDVFQLHANMASCRQSFCAYLHTPPRCCLAPFPFLSARRLVCSLELWKTARNLPPPRNDDGCHEKSARSRVLLRGEEGIVIIVLLLYTFVDFQWLHLEMAKVQSDRRKFFVKISFHKKIKAVSSWVWLRAYFLTSYTMR